MAGVNLRDGLLETTQVADRDGGQDAAEAQSHRGEPALALQLQRAGEFGWQAGEDFTVGSTLLLPNSCHLGSLAADDPIQLGTPGKERPPNIRSAVGPVIDGRHSVDPDLWLRSFRNVSSGVPRSASMVAAVRRKS